MPLGDYIPDWFCDATGRYGWYADKLEQAQLQAKLYREQHGDPVDNLAEILSAIANKEVWQDVLDNPDVYGSGDYP